MSDRFSQPTPSANSPRTIIFDLGKVIIDFDHMTFCRNLSAVCAATPVQVYARLFGSGLEKGFDSGELSGEAFYEATRRVLSFSIDIAHFSRLWADIFSLNKGIDSLLYDLRGRYRLLCLSNTNPWHFQWCRDHFPVMEVFDDFILSYKERCCKPDSAIYRIALHKAQAPASQCIYIDDIADNVEGARRLGIQAFVFTSVNALAHDLAAAGVTLQADSFMR